MKRYTQEKPFTLARQEDVKASGSIVSQDATLTHIPSNCMSEKRHGECRGHETARTAVGRMDVSEVSIPTHLSLLGE